MPDLPERVWVSPLGVFPVEMGGSVPYVPEQRALAAERERDELREQMEIGAVWATQRDEMNVALRAQVATLTAERDALVPLVRLAGLVLESVQQGQPLTAFDVEFAAEHYGVDLTAARAILGRVP